MPAPKRTAADSPTLGAASGVQTPPEPALSGKGLAGVDADATMKIGEVAERLGLSMRSIRYYEETGLVRPTSRTSGGFRLYSELDVQRLLLIMQMKPLDFTLEQMREVLDDLALVQRTGPESAPDAAPAAQARERLGHVLRDVDQRWAFLQQRLEIAAMFRDHLAQEVGAGVTTAAPPAPASP